MSRIALIGSCVTRDVWPVLGRPPGELLFTARTGLVSITSAPLDLPVDPACFKLDSDFQRACLDYDVNKRTLPAVEAFRPDVVILDFIDERFDILQIGSAYVSYSHEFQLAGAPDMAWAAGGRVIDRLSTEADGLWMMAARRLVDALRASPVLRRAKVVLHRAPWVRHEVQGVDLTACVAATQTASRQQITFGKVVEVEAYGRLMTRYYDHIQAIMPEIQAVEVDQSFHLGAAQHMWGPSPFHYVSSYYRDFERKMQNVGITM